MQEISKKDIRYCRKLIKGQYDPILIVENGVSFFNKDDRVR